MNVLLRYINSFLLVVVFAGKFTYGVRTLESCELGQEKQVINTSCKVLYFMYIPSKQEVTSSCFFTGTLIASDWVVRVYHSEEPEITLTEFPLVVMHDSSGKLYFSSVDRIVPCSLRYLAREGSFFTIIFLHLSNPISGIKPLEYDLSLNDKLVGKTCFLMGHDWTCGGVNYGDKDPDVAKSPDSIGEFCMEVINDVRPKVGELTLECCSNVAARMDLLYRVDSMIQEDQMFSDTSKLREIFPIASNSFKLAGVYSIFKRDMLSAMKNKAHSDYGYLYDQNIFLCSTYNDPKLSGKQLASKDMHVEGSFPNALEGESVVEVRDRGAGIYAYSESRPLLVGIVGGVDLMGYKCIEINGEKLGRTTLIIPARLIKYLFDEHCVPEKDKKCSAKSRSKSRKKQSKRVDKKGKEKEDIGEGKGEESAGEERESKVEENTLEQEETAPKTPKSSEARSKSPKEQLDNTRWAAIITKTGSDGRPYKETYNFYLKKSGVCEHSVGLVKSRCIMGDHKSNGLWSIKNAKGREPRIIVKLNNKRGLKDCELVFKLNKEGHLIEVEDKAKLANEEERTGKVRSLMFLRKISNSCKNLLACFDFDESYESVISDYVPSFILDDEEYKLYQTSSCHTELSLEGKWSCIGLLRSSLGEFRQKDSTSFEIAGDKVRFGGVPHSIEYKLRYALEDVEYKQEATCLKLIPDDSSAGSRRKLPINIAVYRTNSGKIILARPYVSICDYSTSRLMELQPMRLFARQD